MNLTIKELFVSYGSGTDKNFEARNFYILMNENVSYKSKYSISRNYKGHRIGGDVVFNYCGSINKYLDTNNELVLFALTMCYTNLNKSFISGVGRGRNLNVVKNSPKGSQGFDRPDLLAYRLNCYYKNIKIKNSIDEIVNEDTMKFINEFNSIEEYHNELYSLPNSLKKNELEQIINNFFICYEKYIIKNKYKIKKLNSFIKVDLNTKVSCLEKQVMDFIVNHLNDDIFNITEVMLDTGSKKIYVEGMQKTGNELELMDYCCLSIVFWAIRLNAFINKIS